MKPVTSGGHATYQHLVVEQLNRYFPELSGIPRDYLIIAERFYELDLSPLDELMSDRYSSFGPKPRQPSDMLRSMLLAIELRITSFTKWAAQLKTNPFCAIVSGFVVGDVPGIGTFYDFSSRLWMSDRSNINDHIRLPNQKPAPPSIKGDKADPVEKTTVADLLASLQVASPSKDVPYARLFEIFDVSFLRTSIQKGLVDPQHISLAGDGTPVVTSARERSRLPDKTEDDDPFHPDPSKKRFYSQPDCDIGWDSSRNMYFSGYSLYMLTETNSERDLPIFPLLAPASSHDSLTFARTWFSMKSFLPDLHTSEMLLDSAHDAMPYYTYFRENGISAFIDINLKRGIRETYHDTFTIAKDGAPVCTAGLKMSRDGYDKAKGTIKYRCPYASSTDGISCHCDNPCSDSAYGRVVKLPSNSNPRLFTIPARDSREWKDKYKHRTCAERCNKRMKIDMQLENGRHRSSKMWYCRLYCTMMCQHLDAWDLPHRFLLETECCI